MKITFKKGLLAAIAALTVCSARADEGMWLLQLMKQQNSIDMMKKQGLKLEADDLYNPNGVSLKDAVGIFGGGCTGEIISPEGLILTNHHCGYGAIQQHSSVEHDYLTDGFWAMNRSEELPTPGLKFRFVHRIVDITDLGANILGFSEKEPTLEWLAEALGDNPLGQSSECTPMGILRKA